ncbi:hypothetical protein VNI00_017162 [Paramarasmius palmivorus]|uniref:Uncharacterized protein n=1 Tax=Paramarasmius palmivorus TaxID=297713 RepID=A0AAW0B7F5_9AGAR
MATTLLTVPAEIRAVIIESVLLSKRAAPPDIEAAEAMHHPFQLTIDVDKQLAAQFNTWDPGPRHVRFEDQKESDGRIRCTSNSLPLLLTNRQINFETSSAIARLGEKVRQYDLDVFVVDEYFLTTWTCIPILTTQVDRVNVTFRVHSISPRAFRIGDGSPPQIYWWFYFLLEYFLKRGPVSPTLAAGAPRVRDREIGVREIVLDFQGVGSGAENPREGLGNIVVQAKRGFGALIFMNYHTAKYGGIVYERVGSVRFCFNGEVDWEVDLGDGLDKLRHEDPQDTFGHLWPRENRVPAFQEWKKNAKRLREERGFKLVH